MAEPAAHPPVIIIKKKGAHGGHHGGAWKVAYADFVTAMMALFIVLWLLSSSSDVQKSVASYFRDPKGVGKQAGSSMSGSGESLKIMQQSKMDLLKSKIEESIHSSTRFESIKDYVQMTVTNEGLRIELLETQKGMFFQTGQPGPTDNGKELLAKLAPVLGTMPNTILIEGHTDAQPFDGRKYSNWELSIDRANAARSIMQKNGLQSKQVAQVRGYADQQLRLPANPTDPANRRVSIIVQFSQSVPQDEPKGKEKGEENGETDKTPAKGKGETPAAPEKGEHGKE